MVIDFKNKLYTYKTDIFLPEGIEIINTPGHTLPHWSIVAKEDGKNIVFSGDAIRPEMLNEDYSPEGQDIPKLIDSAFKICEIADEIVPGHGPNLDREEIEKIKNNLLKFKNK